MVSHEYPPNRFDPVGLEAFRRATMLPSFTSPSQAIDRFVRLGEARDAPMGMNGTGSVRDERDERLERAGYLLVVGIDRLVRAIAAFGWRIVRSPKRRKVTAARRSVSVDETTPGKVDLLPGGACMEATEPNELQGSHRRRARLDSFRHCRPLLA